MIAPICQIKWFSDLLLKVLKEKQENFLSMWNNVKHIFMQIAEKVRKTAPICEMNN